MNAEAEDLALRVMLRRLFRRGLGLLGVLLLVASLVSMATRDYLQQQFAEHLSQTVRNDLLIGNNAAVLKILNQNLAENFSRISFHDRQMTLFELINHSEDAWIEADAHIPICLQSDQKDCAADLIFQYSLNHYLPLVWMAGAFIIFIFVLIFWVFRQHVAAYYRDALKHEKEAALGRLSARICHDLKLPCMIFQRVAYVDDPTQFLALKPQLQSHLQRLYAMLEKLKRAELEGLIRMETQTVLESDLRAFLTSIAPKADQLYLSMRPSLRLYLDLDKFERCLANLVLNAFQANAGHVKVSLQDRQYDLIATVENDGPPMSEELVQAFLHPGHPGLLQSLGLRMVRETVLAHGGRIDLTSTEGTTRFTLYFPNTVIGQEAAVPCEETQKPDPLATRQLIWLDEDLHRQARRYFQDSDVEPFAFSSDDSTLDTASLVISRMEETIDRAIQKAIPIIMAGMTSDDLAWLDALKIRLRMLKKQLSTTPVTRVQTPGRELEALLH